MRHEIISNSADQSLVVTDKLSGHRYETDSVINTPTKGKGPMGSGGIVTSFTSAPDYP